MSLDPVETNPEFYKVIFENDRVRVLEYTDVPGDRTTPHGWLPAQEHAGENIGDTPTRVLFVELKDGAGHARAGASLGPDA